MKLKSLKPSRYAFVTYSHYSMPGIASNRAHSAALPTPGSRRAPGRKPNARRIIEAATQHFAEHGYHAARVGDIATALGIAKGSIFQHFGSKDGLFFEVYKRAVRSFAKYLDAPAEIRAGWFLRGAALLAGAHRAPGARGLDSLSHFAAGKLRHRFCAEARDQPLPDQRRSLRHGEFCALRAGAPRTAQGHGHRDDRLDPRLDDGALPGCAAYRGTRSRIVPPPGRTGGKEGSQNPAVSGRVAAGDRRQRQQCCIRKRSVVAREPGGSAIAVSESRLPIFIARA